MKQSNFVYFENLTNNVKVRMLHPIFNPNWHIRKEPDDVQWSFALGGYGSDNRQAKTTSELKNVKNCRDITGEEMLVIMELAFEKFIT